MIPTGATGPFVTPNIFGCLEPPSSPKGQGEKQEKNLFSDEMRNIDQNQIGASLVFSPGKVRTIDPGKSDKTSLDFSPAKKTHKSFIAKFSGHILRNGYKLKEDHGSKKVYVGRDGKKITVQDSPIVRSVKRLSDSESPKKI